MGKTTLGVMVGLSIKQDPENGRKVRRRERTPEWWDMFRIAWFKNTTNPVTDNCLITRLAWEMEGLKGNVTVSQG